MKNEFEVLKATRKLVANTIKNLSLDELHFIPNNFNNNIAWNVAHLVVTQQLLCYKLADKDCLIPDDLIENYRKGTSPKEKFTQEEWEEILELFLGLPDTLEEDFLEGIFTNYNEYTTSTGFTLKNIKDAICFNNYHEGIHFGSILALKRFVR